MNLYSFFHFSFFKKQIKEPEQEVLEARICKLDVGLWKRRKMSPPHFVVWSYIYVLSVLAYCLFLFVCFFSTVPISVVMDSYPITYLLLILNHKPNLSTGLTIPLCHIWVKSVNFNILLSFCSWVGCYRKNCFWTGNDLSTRDWKQV